eukprot:TRINITY_DN725_c0_g3_i2.p2 TRINITY_DN725_c0_g3~~TRINITY_DN725_c0_g3_i2.p2  ORF type:complete len:139 (+),score=46.78 TRINITY_DN725_c0_g3_i2:129-545(+)
MEETKSGIRPKEYTAENLQDAIDVLDAILGNEEGIMYIVGRAFKELPAKEEGKCLGRNLHYMVANVMGVWKHMLNMNITQDFVGFVLGPEAEAPDCSYNAEQFKGFIIKVFTALRTMLIERKQRMKEEAPLTTESTEA